MFQTIKHFEKFTSQVCTYNGISGISAKKCKFFFIVNLEVKNKCDDETTLYNVDFAAKSLYPAMKKNMCKK